MVPQGSTEANHPPFQRNLPRTTLLYKLATFTCCPTQPPACQSVNPRVVPGCLGAVLSLFLVSSDALDDRSIDDTRRVSAIRWSEQTQT